MAATFVFSVYELSIAKPHVLHDSGQGNIPYLHCSVDVSRHQTKSMDAVPESFNAFLQQQNKARTVVGIEEDVLPAIAAKNDMINGTGIMKSWFTWQVIRLR
jgi:hypothetical protein